MQPINYRVKNAKYIGNYSISLEFQDGVSGVIDMSKDLDIGPLKELQDKKLFSQFEVHPIFKTLCWPNGADLAPEFLRENLK